MTQDNPESKQTGLTRCPNCGEELPDTLSVCPMCGARVKSPHSKYTPMKQSTMRIIRWVVGAACVLAFLLYFFIFKK